MGVFEKKLTAALAMGCMVLPVYAATKKKASTSAHGHAAVHHTAAKAAVAHTSSRTSGKVSSRSRHGRVVAISARSRRHKYVERFTAPSFTNDTGTLTTGDVTAGEDPVVRAALLHALGNYNGTALAIDPKNGRVLAMVNQKLALGPGAEPCSTIKLAVSLAALQEGLIKRDTPVEISRHYSLDLTHALAKSVNPYFEVLGRRMGFERVKYYANQFGLGEKAGLNIDGEQLGVYPSVPLPEKLGGVGKMCSFGESISLTPLQLGALVAAISNGGTLYYLQHPENPEEVAAFTPRVKRQLDIAPIIPEILPGMRGAVDFSNGTGRSVRANFNEFPVLGKTGTCSNKGTRYGWFGSFADTPNGRIVAVFFLTGGRPVFGPKAAELSGMFYRALADASYYPTMKPVQPLMAPVMMPSNPVAPFSKPSSEMMPTVGVPTQQ